MKITHHIYTAGCGSHYRGRSLFKMPYVALGALCAAITPLLPQNSTAPVFPGSPKGSGSGQDWRVTALANEDETVCVAGLANELVFDSDGWVKIAPYGDMAKRRLINLPDGTQQEQRFIQRLDRTSAQAMVDKFHGLRGTLKRYLVGVPLYKRHPDLKVHTPEAVRNPLANDDRIAGQIADIAAREDGFYAKPVMNKLGTTAIENEGLKWISPFWNVRWPINQDPSQQAVICNPFELLSGGLTDKPNIKFGVDALANEWDDDPEDANPQMKQPTLKELVLALCASHQVALANEATDEQIMAGLKPLVTNGQRITALENEQTKITKSIETAQTALANEQAAHGLVKAALVQERKARIDAIVSLAIVEGRIFPSEKGKWETALANESSFDAQVTALGNEGVKMHIKPATKELGDRKVEAGHAGQSAMEQCVALANEEIRKGTPSDEAWNKIKLSHPALFVEMENPKKQ